jgi:hypothetical protein
MAKKQVSIVSALSLLQFCLGVFFIVLGVSNLTNYNSDWSELKRAFGKNDGLSLAMAVVELVMGAILVFGLFLSVSADLTKLLGIVLFILWALYIVLAFFIQNFLEPNFLTWLYRLSWHGIILISLWIVGKKYI